MSGTIVLVIALAVGAICPLHMWWQRRRGHDVSCAMSSRDSRSKDDVTALAARQAVLARQISELDERDQPHEPATRA